jgi:two-component SAPR family response regulator
VVNTQVYRRQNARLAAALNWLYMHTPCVVAVDDDVAILKLVEMTLEPLGYKVLGFNLPERALEELEAGLRPDVIVSDVSMPGINGFDFCQKAQELSHPHPVAFLFLSALSERQHIRRGMNLGADDYLTKPFAPGELLEAVKMRVSRQSELRRPVEGLISVKAMAGAEVARDGDVLEWDSQKALELFFYLLENRAGVSTWQVAEALWPGKTEAKASSSFHTTLYRLRKVIGEELIESSNRRYYLHSKFAVDYDVSRYRGRSALAKEVKTPQAFDEAIAAYGGDFLPGFDSPWVEEMRNALRDEHLNLLLLAAETSREAGQLESATNYYAGMTRHQPETRLAWQGLIDILELRGRGEEAQSAREQAKTFVASGLG